MFTPSAGRGRQFFGSWALYPETRPCKEHKHICGPFPGGTCQGGELGREGGALAESCTVIRNPDAASDPYYLDFGLVI